VENVCPTQCDYKPEWMLCHQWRNEKDFWPTSQASLAPTPIPIQLATTVETGSLSPQSFYVAKHEDHVKVRDQ
jgi:hypothetical protein